MPRILDPKDKYYIDNPGRVKAIQAEMHKRKIDVYLGSRIRTMSFVMDTFCPWRSYIIIPPEGQPSTLRLPLTRCGSGDERGWTSIMFAPTDPWVVWIRFSAITDYIKEEIGIKKERIGYEDGISVYTAEGNLTHWEYTHF